MAGKTISQRITLEGGDEVKKQLEALGDAGEASFKQIQDAAENTKVDPAVAETLDRLIAAGSQLADKFAALANAAETLAPQLDQLGKLATAAGEGFDKTADGITAVTDASQKATPAVADSGDAAQKSSTSYVGLGLAVVKTAASVVSAGAALEGAAASTASLGVATIGAAASVGSFAILAGRVLVGALGAAIAGVEAFGAAAKVAAGKYEALNHTLQTLAQTSGVTFEALQKGAQALEAMGIQSETARAAVTKLNQTLGDLDPAAKLKASADQLLATEKALLEAQLKVQAAGGKFADPGAATRLLEIEAKLRNATNDRAIAEKAASDAADAHEKALANNLTNIVSLIKAIEAGQKNIKFDEATTAETKLDALNIRLKEVKDAGGDAGQAFLTIIANAPKLKDALAFGKQAGFSDADVDRIRNYGGEASKIPDLFKRVQQAGALIGPDVSASLEQARQATQDVENAWKRLEQAWASTIIARAGAAISVTLDRIKAAILNFVGSGLESINAWIARLPDAVDTSIAQVRAVIVALVTTPVSDAWTWLADTFNSAMTSIGTAISTAWAAITAFVTTPVANAWQWIKDKWDALVSSLGFSGGGAVGDTGGGAGFASGGLLGGRGTGTSDSNLAWVSRGEYITPAHAVRQPGVLAFLEALRRTGGNLAGVLDGMGQFALGGMVTGPRLAIPAFAGGGMHSVTINFPGLPSITGLRASSDVVDELRKAAAMAQVRSGGRKPSRYT